MNRPLLGVLGGVGPLATAYFLKLLVERTPARTDQEHLPVLVYNDPQIPDRTAFIMDRTQPDPLPEMIRVARALQDAGVDHIAMPCNTAHYFYESLQEAIDVPMLNIVDATVNAILGTVDGVRRVGIMATEGTVSSGVYDMYFAKHGVTVAAPDASDQEVLNDLIYGRVKANRPYDGRELVKVAHNLLNNGCDAVVVGCTELSVVYQGLPSPVERTCDSLATLADLCIQTYVQAQRGHHDGR